MPRKIFEDPYRDKNTEQTPTEAYNNTNPYSVKVKQKSIFNRVKNLDLSHEYSVVDSPQVQRTLDTIANLETSIVPEGKKYSFTKKADNSRSNYDLGKYQVTSKELASYGKQFLGRTVSDKEFLNNPQLQEQYMKNKVQFLMNEGLTPGKILALHAEGMTGWGDRKVISKKIQSANKYRSDYVKRGLDFMEPLFLKK